MEENLKRLTKKDIEDGKKISVMFATLDEVSKTMAMVYLSALRDKQLVSKCG
ncbi:hypothetical protein [Anaerotignum sp.]|uniref:hypothetical protein n=1 Tax=Anaerotignum sp. TaxID=2039241 RepID=UPI0028A9490C|nr:hypothetical protein [Anaerotignum sp.]